MSDLEDTESSARRRKFLPHAVAEAYSDALKRAALEAFEGQYVEAQLEAMIYPEQIRGEALTLIYEGDND
ncbi:MAG: hypothetical protein O7E52_06140 [Candidatus Poribacteria bacterium]|nr:hypothetical protein [Candidatus Poribacteria bacterium]